MSTVKPGDWVVFQHHDPTVLDRRNGQEGIVVEENELHTLIREAFFGKDAVTIEYPDGGRAIAVAGEYTLVERN